MLYAYAGTWMNNPFEPHNGIPDIPGIYGYAVDLATGDLEPLHRAAQPDPSYLAISARHRMLYAPSHTPTTPSGQPGSTVIAYRLQPGSGAMEPVGSLDLEIVEPAHIALDLTEDSVLLACTKGGGVVLLPLHGDGTFTGHQHVHVDGNPRVPFPPTEQTKVRARSYAERRALGVTSPHGIGVDLTGQVVLVADRDLDGLAMLSLDREAGRLVPLGRGYGASQSGPRHFAFHPANSHAYVVNELDSSVGIFAFNPTEPSLRLLGAASSVPAGFGGKNQPGGIKVLRNGKFLYVTNRGHDSIATFAIDPGGEHLSLVTTTPVLGEGPWSITLTPGDALLYATNKLSHNIVSFHVDRQTGALSPTGSQTALRGVTNIAFWQDVTHGVKA